jgi:dihydroorotase-like cyclic amidohydrolase
MPSVDLVVKHGLVFTPQGLLRSDVAVDEGRIAKIFVDGSYEGDETLDAEGKVVIPGLVDTHDHFREPGFEEMEDWLTGSKAAAAGGVTMAVGMPNTMPPPSSLEAFKRTIDLASKSHVDFNHWGLPTDLAEIPKIAEYGAIGFKFFMQYDHWGYPHLPEYAITNSGEMLETFRAVAGTGLPCAVHPFDQELWEFKEKTVKKHEGQTEGMIKDFLYQDKAIVTNMGITKAVLLADAVNCRLHVLHVNTKRPLQLCRMFKDHGYRITVETNPRAIATVWRTEPADVEAALGAIGDGTTDVVGSDHAPKSRDVAKRMGPGWPFVQNYLRVMLTHVNRGTLRLDAVVRTHATNPAKLLGVYPRKGILAEGSDADFAVVDMKERYIIKAEDNYSKSNWVDPWEGTEVQGAPVMTVVRGTTVMDDGEIVGKPGYGQFVRPILHP